jgi:hypothetical protein
MFKDSMRDKLTLSTHGRKEYFKVRNYFIQNDGTLDENACIGLGTLLNNPTVKHELEVICSISFQGRCKRREVGVSLATVITEESIQRIIRALRRPRNLKTEAAVLVTVPVVAVDVLEVVPAPVTQMIQSSLASSSAAKSAFVSPDQARKVGSRKRLCDHSTQSQKRIVKESEKLLQEKMGISPEDSLTLAALMLARE